MAATPYKEWPLDIAKGVPLQYLLFNQCVMDLRVDITLFDQGFYDRKGLF
ncbi:MAG: hypothetical protein ACQEUM_01010 [Pseudomonadota bacterium]